MPRDDLALRAPFIRDVVLERGHVEAGKLTAEQLDAALDGLAMARDGR